MFNKGKSVVCRRTRIVDGRILNLQIGTAETLFLELPGTQA